MTLLDISIPPRNSVQRPRGRPSTGMVPRPIPEPRVLSDAEGNGAPALAELLRCAADVILVEARP